jgi:hypothetical protein
MNTKVTEVSVSNPPSSSSIEEDGTVVELAT